MRSRRARWTGAWLAIALTAASARAGLGPENLAIVVNEESWASLAVANAYAELYGVPAGNLIHLPDAGGFEHIDVADFRERILAPLLAAIEARGLTAQIDAVAYSSDLPYAVNARPDVGELKLPEVLRPMASLTGLTYLHALVSAANPAYLSLAANSYARPPLDARQRALGVPDSAAFRSRYGWAPGGERDDGGARYLLSTALAVTSGRGTSLREALDALRGSHAARGSRPEGTIYFMTSADVRSQTRAWAFPAAAEALRQLGVAAETLPGNMPRGRADVAGLVAGVAKFDWPGTGSAIRPGALCEHLTSLGGALRENAVQTPLSEFLRHGAAGASGTVAEPLAVQAKFPTAFAQLHYARGLSLAEAFYRSLAAPYQLLIVADPLSAPWAREPLVELREPRPGASLRGEVSIRASAAPHGEVGRFELYVDGKLLADAADGEALRLDTRSLPDGPHELRVVGVADSALETRGRSLLPVRVANSKRRLTLVARRPRLRLDQTLRLDALMPGAHALVLRHGARELGRAEGTPAEFAVPARRLGLGGVGLHAEALDGSGRVVARSRVLAIEVAPPPLRPALPEPRGLLPGLRLLPEGGQATRVLDTRLRSWLRDAGVAKGQGFRLEAWFRVPEDDLYQLQLHSPQRLSIEVSGSPVALRETRGWQYLPLHLAAGLHHLALRSEGAGEPRLAIRFGGSGTRSLSGERFSSPLEVGAAP